MKKIYLSVLSLFAFAISVNAQTETEDFASPFYLAAASDVTLHDSWLGEGGWTYDTTLQRIAVAADWANLVNARALTAADGGVISASIMVRFDGDEVAFDDTENRGMFSFGFKSNGLAAKSEWADRSVSLVKQAAGNIELQTQGHFKPGGGRDDEQPFGFDPAPSVSNAQKGLFEVTVTLNIADSGFNSSLTSSVKNMSTGEKSVATSNVISDALYTAVTGSGAHVWFWTYGAFGGAIKNVFIESFTTSNTESLGVAGVGSIDFEIANNPVGDDLAISTQETIESIEVINLAGQTVATSSNVSSLATGVYIVKVSSANGVSTAKFVKQ